MAEDCEPALNLRSAWKVYNVVLQCGGWLRVQWFYKSGCLINYSLRILKMDQIRWVRPAFVSDRRRWSLKSSSSPSSSLPRLLLTFCIQLVFSPRLCRFRFKHSMRAHSSDFLYPLSWFLFYFLEFFSRWSDRDSRPTTPAQAP